MALVNTKVSLVRFGRQHPIGICIVVGVITFIILRHFREPRKTNLPTFQKLSENLAKSSFADMDEIEEDLFELDQRDSQLIQYVRARYLTPPSKLPYNLEKNRTYKGEFNSWVSHFFRNKTNGIFIEAGANEGEITSHTLHFERELGWGGLLIECNPFVTPVLKSRNRKAWVASACLAPNSKLGILNFTYPTDWTQSGTFKKAWKIPNLKNDWRSLDVETVPLFSILAAIGLYEVDYFSFDIEGVELRVLRKFPFDLVTFKVLIIEVMFYTGNEKKELNELLTENGYYLAKDMHKDRIYVHNSVKHMLDDYISDS